MTTTTHQTESESAPGGETFVPAPPPAGPAAPAASGSDVVPGSQRAASSDAATSDDTRRGAAGPGGLLRRPFRPTWERLMLLGLLVATGVLYLWNLSINGYGNSFYAAAEQAGSQSWSAFLWGASDTAGSITVDKPPASLWLSGLAIRVFGLSSWTVLVPQVILGVLSVWLLYSTVRRRFSAGGALLAGVALALTPIAALMFRFNNPDALLVLLMIATVYCVMRAVEDGRTRWMVLAGVAVGFGFLTKQMQVFLVLPGVAAAYLWAAPVSIPRRIRDSFLAVGAIVVSAGWWVLLTVVVPASARPFIGGSQNNSFLELTFGYNGFGRLTGDETGSVGGGGGGNTTGGMWGATGIGRLFTDEFAGQFSWLAPAAAVFLVAGLALTVRAKRTDGRRAAFVAWGGWLVVTWLTFSFMAGIFHQYYTVALAPAIAALFGMGASLLWSKRSSWWVTVALAVATLSTAWWSYNLLQRSASFEPWLRGVVLLGGFVAAIALVAARFLGADRTSTRIAAGGAALAVASMLAGPLAYSLDTVATSHTGSIVTAGPSTGSTGFGGGPAGGGGQGGGGRGGFGGGPGGQNQQGGQQGQGTQQGQQGGQSQGGGGTTQQGQSTQQGGSTGGTTGNQAGGVPGGQTGGATTGGMPGGGGGGGLLEGASVSSDLVAALSKDAGSYTWVAATTGSQNAASYQLATEHSVMPIGGFNGSDPSPTLAQFEQYVAEGKIHYYVGSSSGGMGGSQMGGSNDASQISSWVADHFTASTIGGTTVYDLTAPTSGSTSSTDTTTSGT